MDTPPPSIVMPDNFPVVLKDFTNDLSLTFPEYKYLWESMPETPEPIYHYCLGVYPERFFDILYQNDEIFDSASEINTHFLPNIDFKILFNTEGISETTKEAIWKYLQLILITIMSGIKDKSGFGESMGLFEGIDESELESKLTETIHGLNDFFKNIGNDFDSFAEQACNDNNAENDETCENGTSQKPDFSFDMSGGIPDAAGIHEHLKNLFDGKIGKLAKELAEEFSKDFMGMFGEGEVKNTQDIFKKIMKNPKKIMELMKTISSKIEDKMKNGDISKDEIMKEASELMNKMKGMGGKKEFQNMMKNLTKNMGGLNSAAAAAAGGAGKGQFNMGAMQRMASQYEQKEKMRAKLEKRKTGVLSKTTALLQECESSSSSSGFRVPVPVPPPTAPINDDWLNDYDNIPKSTSSAPKTTKSKKKGKK